MSLFNAMPLKKGVTPKRAIECTLSIFGDKDVYYISKSFYNEIKSNLILKDIKVVEASRLGTCRPFFEDTLVINKWEELKTNKNQNNV